jgi:carbonic anhydrase/acetyltransferase-like protein (isoleucine patch superfamily)
MRPPWAPNVSWAPRPWSREAPKIPDGSLVLGAPAKVVRALSQEEPGRLKDSAE